MLDLNARDYQTLANVVLKAKSEVPTSSLWSRLHDNYGIGVLTPAGIQLAPRHRQALVQLVEKELGLNLKKDKYESLKNMSRTEVSSFANNEKFIGQSPRSRFMEIRTYDGDSITVGYKGVTLQDVLKYEVELVLSIENFDTFTSLDCTDLIRMGLDHEERILIVYRGDSKALPTVVKNYREIFTGRWIHFGDFDPKGLHIGLVEMRANFLILPTLEFISKGIPDFNQSALFFKQCEILNKVASQNEDVLSLLCFMKKNEIALTQEHLIARSVPLQIQKTL